MDSETRQMLRDTAEDIFGGETADLWRTLQEAGFDKALLPESKGGSDLSWEVALELVRIAAQHAAAVPLAEAIIGYWLVGFTDLEDVELPTIATQVPGSAVALEGVGGDPVGINGTLKRVPWASIASHVAFVVDSTAPQLVVISTTDSGVSTESGSNLAGEPRDDVVLTNVAPRAVVPAPVSSLGLKAVAAVARGCQISGAIEQTLVLTNEYVKTREQFGRPIGKFQAVQHGIAKLVAQSAAANAAAEAGSEALDTELAENHRVPSNDIAVLSAKIRTSESANEVCSVAHQAFGAIGFTEEHELHHFTKRLWSWRDECGTEGFWADRLGERILNSPTQESVWRSVTTPMRESEMEVVR